MLYSESIDQSAERARSAMEIMEKNGIPLNPNNFFVWYNYVAGRDLDLKKALDDLLESGQEFTEDVNAGLFEKYYAVGYSGSILDQTASRIEAEVDKVLGSLSQAGDGASAFGETLLSADGELTSAADASGLQGVVNKVLTATREMLERNQILQQQLNSSSEEISRLKVDLDVVRREATTDALTGAANRKMFDEALRRATAEATEEGSSLSLLMIDIDHFKKFNDAYGHPVGDQVLKLLASTLKEGIKGQDTAARYGGEEFAVILPHTELSDAVRLADSLRQQLAEKRLRNRTTGEDMGRITVSIGVGLFDPGEPLAQFVVRADEALYLAKQTGRDRVMSENELSATALVVDK